MEQTDTTPKSSIFLCRSCKADVEVSKRQKKSDPTDKPETVVVTLKPAKDANQDSKYTIKIQGKQVSFGAKGYSDYTQNQDGYRKNAYISRHQPREEQYWSHSAENLKTAAYWSRWLLWEFMDIFEAIKHIEKEQNITIKYTENTIKKHQRKLAKSVKKLGVDEQL